MLVSNVFVLEILALRVLMPRVFGSKILVFMLAALILGPWVLMIRVLESGVLISKVSMLLSALKCICNLFKT